MDIITGIGALSGVLKGASQLVRELKTPKVTKDDFLAVLQQEYSKSGVSSTQWDQRRSKVEELSGKFISVRDTDANKLLSLEESGLKEATFQKLDSNGDGQLSAAELQRPFMEYIQALEERQS